MQYARTLHTSCTHRESYCIKYVYLYSESFYYISLTSLFIYCLCCFRHTLVLLLTCEFLPINRGTSYLNQQLFNIRLTWKKSSVSQLFTDLSKLSDWWRKISQTISVKTFDSHMSTKWNKNVELYPVFSFLLLSTCKYFERKRGKASLWEAENRPETLNCPTWFTWQTHFYFYFHCVGFLSLTNWQFVDLGVSGVLSFLNRAGKRSPFFPGMLWL